MPKSWARSPIKSEAYLLVGLTISDQSGLMLAILALFLTTRESEPKMPKYGAGCVMLTADSGL